MLNPQENKIKQLIEEEVKKQINKANAFTGHRIIDTPTDNLAIVNRKYVTNNGTVANRPKSSVATIGQPYYATDTFIPMTYSTQGWRNGVGSIVALNN